MPDSFFLIIPGICYLLAGGLILLEQFTNKKSLTSMTTALIWVSLTGHIILLIARFNQMPETLFTSVREFAILLSALLVIGYLLTAKWLRGMGIAGAVMCVAGLILVITAPSLLAQPQAVPVILSNPLLLLHVPLVLLAYLSFALAAVASAMYLIISDLLKARRPVALSPQLPTLGSLEHFTYKMTQSGFVLLTVGIIIGMVWSHQVWGMLIPKSPKLIMALVAWVMYGIYFHLWYARKSRGRICAWLLVVNFIIIIIGLLVPVVTNGPHKFI